MDIEACDIISIEMRLPVLNGLGTCLATREISSQAVAIMMTAYRQDIVGVVEEIRERKRETGSGGIGRLLGATTGVNLQEAR